MMMVNVKGRRVRVMNEGEGEGNRSRLVSYHPSFPSILLVSPQCLSSVSLLSVSCQCLPSTYARFRFALRPVGGSFVSLMHRERIPIGISFAGSEDKNTLIRSCDPSILNASNFFSSSTSHWGIKWTLFRIVQCPCLCPISRQFIATTSCP